MPLKEFQERVVAGVRRFLNLLAEKQAAGEKHPALDAWNDAKRDHLLPLNGPYRERTTGHGKDLPTFCIQVPTGGGKTLLATQILGEIHKSILAGRNGAGLVLWIVPSDQIYKDTLRALRDRGHFYRESLEHAVSRRLEVWEKHDIPNLTPAQLAATLNVLLLKLPSTNRQDRESLKFFRDGGGNIVAHFPPEDDPDGHRALKERVSNLEMLEDDAAAGRHLVKTSLANLVRLCEPAVILDEGHKATSQLARETIEGFNPSVVVELSATPHAGANVLVRVSGQELLAEEMIKLPINVACSDIASWQDCLALARDRREKLAELAREHYAATGQTIRPIVLVQVERTGKDQRGGGFVHSEDVREHLVSRLGVAGEAIAVKSSDKDDIEGIDLLADGCPVEWIVTKAALQEGWDCPFAYVLVSLNNTKSRQSMTQLVGRVLRQPFVTKSPCPGLNESYVYCLRKTAAEVTREVKAALEDEGYEGEAAAVVDGTEPTAGTSTRTAVIQKKFRRHYTDFDGKIYLPRFCVVNGRAEPEALDYFRHLIARVDVARFDYAAVDWDLTDALAAARDTFYRITLDRDDAERVDEQAAVGTESDDRVKAWLVANLPFDHFSQKQLRLVVGRVSEGLFRANADLAGRLALVKFAVRDRTVGFIQRETDRQSEAAFQALFESGKLKFYLDCLECKFEVPPKVEVRAMRPLSHDNGNPVGRNLFDFIPDDLNEYERSVALYLDAHPQVLWWYRNLVGPQHFAIQGYRQGRIYPDFLVQQGQGGEPVARVLVVESKGQHLAGNADTLYKKSVADYFEKAGRLVPWQQLGEEFQNHTFRFQVLDQGDYADRDWRTELKKRLE